MAAVWLLAWTDARRHWRALVGLGLLMGLAGAAVVAPLIGARRTATAYDRLAERTGSPDFSMLVVDQPAVEEGVRTAAEVGTTWSAFVGVARQVGRPDLRYLAVTFGPPRPPGLLEPIVVEGRAPRPDAIEEVMVNENFAEEAGIDVGDRLDLEFLTQEEFFDFGGFGEPDGPHVGLDVVGMGRYPPPAGNGLGLILATPAFDAAYHGRVGGGAALLGHLRRGVAGVDALQAEVDRLTEAALAGGETPADDQFTQTRVAPASETREGTAGATGVLVTGLLAFAATAAVAGLVAVGLALNRHHARTSQDRLRLALGMSQGQRALALALPVGGSALLAVPMALAVAIAASPLSPSASLARLEPSPGVEVNVALLALGGLAVLVVMSALGAASAWLATGRAERGRKLAPRRPPALATGLGRIGARLPATVGAGMALDTRASSGVPARLSLAGAVVGVAGVVAVASFLASLERLVETPARFGWPAELQVADVDDATLARLVADPSFDAVADVATVPVMIEGRVVSGYAFVVQRGQAPDVGFTVLEGRMPASPDEVLIGPGLLDELGKAIGDDVAIGDGGTMTVVGRGLSPGSDGESFTRALVLTPQSLGEVGIDEGFREAALHLAPGVSATDVAARLGRDLELSVATPPPEVANVGQVDGLTAMLAAFLALLAVAVVTHAVLESVRHRRTDFAVLRSVGFTPSQAGTTIVAMATTWVLLGLTVGIPLGLVLGRTAWARVASDLHVAGDLAIPWSTLVILLPAGVAGALLITAVPSWQLARTRLGTLLRTP